MPTPDQLQQDHDFMSASPDDQHSYLMQSDPDYAKASSDEQHGYLKHLTSSYAPPAAGGPSSVKMEESTIPKWQRGALPQEMPGVSDGANLAEGLSDYDRASFGRMGEGIGNVAKGNFAKGGHQILSGGMNAAAPSMAFMPGASLVRMGVGGTLGSTIGSNIAKNVGATEDQQDLAGDVGGIAGGIGAERLGARMKFGGPNPGRFERLMNVAKKEAHIPLMGKVKPYAEAFNEPQIHEGAPLPVNPERLGESEANLRMLKRRGAEQVMGQPAARMPRPVSTARAVAPPTPEPPPPTMRPVTTARAVAPPTPEPPSPTMRPVSTARKMGSVSSTPVTPPIENGIEGTLANPSGRLVLTPSETRMAAQRQRLATIRAKQNGMQYAGGMRPAAGKVPRMPIKTIEEEY